VVKDYNRRLLKESFLFPHGAPTPLDIPSNYVNQKGVTSGMTPRSNSNHQIDAPLQALILQDPSTTDVGKYLRPLVGSASVVGDFHFTKDI
jgi:hypothetical protein